MSNAGATSAKDAAQPILGEYMTRAELAKELSMSVDTLCRWATARVGPPCIKVGNRVLYSRERVKAWLKAQETTAERVWK